MEGDETGGLGNWTGRRKTEGGNKREGGGRDEEMNVGLRRRVNKQGKED